MGYTPWVGMCKPGYLLVPAVPTKFPTNTISVDKTVELYDFVRGLFVQGLDKTVEFYAFVHGRVCQDLDKIVEIHNFVHPKAENFSVPGPNWARGPGPSPRFALGPDRGPGPSPGPGPAQRNALGLKSGFRVDRIMEVYDVVQTLTKTTRGQNHRIIPFC